MSTVISGNMVGGAAAPLKTVILEDENGNQFTGVCVESVQIFDATDNDVREGKTYVSDNGASTGHKHIPAYETTQESWLFLPGETFSITLDYRNRYDYTVLQGFIAKFNTSFFDSVETDKIIFNNSVYAVNSTNEISNITKNFDTKSIDLNIINDTDDIYIIHYFTYREDTEE